MLNFTERAGRSLINIVEVAKTTIQKAPTYAMQLRESLHKHLPITEILSGFGAMYLGFVGAVFLATHRAPDLVVGAAIAASLGGLGLAFDGISRKSKGRGLTERTVSDLSGRRSFTGSNLP
ncbi:hypothetical protein A2631_04980 [Candidatus Daviesbacteria bacterium RIFCSPHIGHO2_01_FULL_44_29]|uniref:Uncharacterized protein n=1 Tax=Candidatus Daviesbacteria bacterium RIFCSPHIGHO2_02_FULL_43_12 TaxID=1797776 RepID=A0A1F5KGL0_9BACT|nr:MAG: hypothetical protein A2631_04980 [Candidatus Daviesbacteria bacterium RIFCSPHIGHO2_01_FULL_44_29]OGE40076.1 MAG: hypothetical protein A3D25_04710 [Candidatus Daviesbacteria bacterium RIFCSPHIGHO2_02_FULL_43_12]OGE41443.1 MAG: hypothetical protein A3E86_05100 [Candidatus Daviesbacteria bacterium RIFCSPHIGHO2_12_FULL_47_45]OGE70244.1 MAG: hypothetical protein A3B55_00860 [Candidatus Daviesbacteria bacterium RIFCSPLOWO2_01_FULL_43_15]